MNCDAKKNLAFCESGTLYAKRAARGLQAVVWLAMPYGNTNLLRRIIVAIAEMYVKCSEYSGSTI